jgi:hypothetical protein
VSSRAAVPREDTSRLVGGPSGVREQRTLGGPGKKGTAEPAPLGAVVGEHWRARSVLGTLPDGQKTGLWRTLNQVRARERCQQTALSRGSTTTSRGTATDDRVHSEGARPRERGAVCRRERACESRAPAPRRDERAPSSLSVRTCSPLATLSRDTSRLSRRARLGLAHLPAVLPVNAPPLSSVISLYSTV